MPHDRPLQRSRLLRFVLNPPSVVPVITSGLMVGSKITIGSGGGLKLYRVDSQRLHFITHALKRLIGNG